MFGSLAFAKHEAEGTILRDGKGFPRCFVSKEQNYFFKWYDSAFTRKIMILEASEPCRNWRSLQNANSPSDNLSWDKFKEENYPNLPSSIIEELHQVGNKANVLLENESPEAFIDNKDVKGYTLELNRELSKRYGQLFSAKVFKAFIEKDSRNKEFKNEVLKSFSKKWKTQPFSSLKDKVSVVVSFGLGWEEKYSQATPIYIREFLEDIKSLGLPVRFLRKDPWGSVRHNAEVIKDQLREELETGRDIILVSLCKGTPEILLAESLVHTETEGRFINRILGHVNLSGMLDGTFYSDKSSELLIPKIAGPILKLIPIESARESTRLFGAIDFMRSDIIEGVVQEASQNLPKDLLYINITGAPMSEQIFEQHSPMVPVVRYTLFGKLSEGANDGFLELPNTLIPRFISNNQITLMLDSTHLLGDGMLEGHSLQQEFKRRSLYYTIISRVLQEALMAI